MHVEDTRSISFDFAFVGILPGLPPGTFSCKLTLTDAGNRTFHGHGFLLYFTPKVSLLEAYGLQFSRTCYKTAQHICDASISTLVTGYRLHCRLHYIYLQSLQPRIQRKSQKCDQHSGQSTATTISADTSQNSY